MNRRRLLSLQLAYCFAGLGYNAASITLVRAGGDPLSATSPVAGMVVMAVYGSALVPGWLGWTRTYRALMAFFVLLLGYGGVVRHALNALEGFEAYSSPVAWAAAIGINGVGLVLNAYAAFSSANMSKSASEID